MATRAPQAADTARRRLLVNAAAFCAAGALPPAGAAKAREAAVGAHPAADSTAAFAATWEQGGAYFVGVLAATAGRVAVLHRHEVPTRAHGIAVEPQGTILLAARRPGDWLLRFDPGAGTIVDWDWSDGAFVYNGHVIRSVDGRRLFTTETSLETGAGFIGVRDAHSLEVLARWPTGGIDPHELALAADGGLWVANGGIETRPETGRTKHNLERMNSSLVRLDASDGRITGRWRLEDRRLGVRHLALAADGAVGIALQSEHEDDDRRRSAPVLALWDRRRGLRPVPLPEGVSLAGYGGSIDVLGDGFAVSCPRAGVVARWRLVGGEARWQAPVLLAQACPTATGWSGGERSVVHVGFPGQRAAHSAVEHFRLDDGIRLDNHWALWARSTAATTPASAGPATGSLPAAG